MIKAKITSLLVLFICVLFAAGVWAEEEKGFDEAAKTVQEKLEASVDKLNQLREQVAQEKVPLSRKLNELENKLAEVRSEYQQTSRLLDSRTLSLSNLRSEIKSRKEEATYLSNLLSEYIRNFESRLHIAEIDRYDDAVQEAKLAPENSNLSEQEIYEKQAGLLDVSLRRLEEALGGSSFEGTAVDESGLVKKGTFVLIGPAALFQSEDGEVVGTVEQRLGSLEPTVMTFANPENSQAAADLIDQKKGIFPFDPTLGNAHKIEETKESVIGHIAKGGPVMYPIFTLAAAAMLVAMIKWVSMLKIKKPSKKRIHELLDNVADHDEEGAKQNAKMIAGPVGDMLQSATDHIKEPLELIEEVMYEKVLQTRLKLERFLPFISISAASAPLLGLLGTVTGIINTFKLITVFGSGDVKTLSGGISEALITTEFGLIVAIPSLLLHAFLSRKAKAVVNEMEKAAVAFINQVRKTPFREERKESPVNISAEQIRELFNNSSAVASNGVFEEPADAEGQMATMASVKQYQDDAAGSIMNGKVFSIQKTENVGDAIAKIRSAEFCDDMDSVFVVDGNGIYEGNVQIRQLLIKPEDTVIESLIDDDQMFVRLNTDKETVKNALEEYDMICVAVLDDKNKLVGYVSRQEFGEA